MGGNFSSVTEMTITEAKVSVSEWNASTEVIIIDPTVPAMTNNSHKAWFTIQVIALHLSSDNTEGKVFRSVEVSPMVTRWPYGMLLMDYIGVHKNHYAQYLTVQVGSELVFNVNFIKNRRWPYLRVPIVFTVTERMAITDLDNRVQAIHEDIVLTLSIECYFRCPNDIDGNGSGDGDMGSGDDMSDEDYF